MTDDAEENIIKPKGGDTVDIKRAKEILSEGNCTCAVCCGDMTASSSLRGIAPLLDWYDKKALPVGFSAADKAVGKAPACLYALMGAKTVYARLITYAAMEVFDRFGIYYEYEQAVPMIRNRADTDFCPVELAVKELLEPLEVIAAARHSLEEMKK